MKLFEYSYEKLGEIEAETEEEARKKAMEEIQRETEYIIVWEK